MLRPWIKRASDIDALTKNRSDLLALRRMKNEWAKSVREGIGLTGRAMAIRMGISQAALSKLEKRESEGTITIERLEALDAEQKKARQAHRKIPRLS